jgi:D-glycero-D-manno-heptose 1,7-bisphosphate phosphatase
MGIGCREEKREVNKSAHAVFIDRDGVLNDTPVVDGVPHPPADPDELRILPGVVQALQILGDQKLLRIVVTNQPDVARGTQSKQMIDRIHDRLRRELPIEAIYACFHDNADNCACRKPLPGLIFAAQKDYDIDLARSFMVGDRWSDVVAGEAAGCATFLVSRSYSHPERCSPRFTVDSFLEAAHKIVKLRQSSEEG